MLNTQKAEQIFAKFNIDGIIIPKWNCFRPMYVHPSDDYLSYITGFTGSAGIAVIQADKKVLFVDSRYTLQAAAQAPDFEIIGLKEMPQWMQNNLASKIAYDPWVFTKAEIEKYKTPQTTFIPIEDLYVWGGDRPTKRVTNIVDYPLPIEKSDNKITKVIEILRQKGVDYLLTARPDNIAWLLNKRDLNNKFSMSLEKFMVLDTITKETKLFDKEDIKGYLANIKERKILVDVRIPAALTDILHNKVEAEDPITNIKAIKDETEILYIIEAHKKDGVALTEFIDWLQHTNEPVSELSIADKIYELRSKQANFLGLSFATIAAAREHGAMVHYQATLETNYTVNKGDVVLVDCGAQYWEGTTDITRTYVFQGKPDAEFIKRYTLILKGHISLASCIFPKGTTGAQLDTLARQFLWANMMDYGHCTGHGVGLCLHVHEGPQGFGARYYNVAIEPGMVLSIEPGYYDEATYGIRLENLYYVKEVNKDFCAFEALTLVPFINEYIDFTLFTQQEKRWLVDYHKKTFVSLKGISKNIQLFFK